MELGSRRRSLRPAAKLHACIDIVEGKFVRLALWLMQWQSWRAEAPGKGMIFCLSFQCLLNRWAPFYLCVGLAVPCLG